MRTTLTLDPDVAAMLVQYRRERDLGLKEAINEALRVGLQTATAPARRRRAFVTQVVDHGPLKVSNVDDVGGILETLEELPGR